ncbi:hypothetical protein OPQ81_008388 [Rhizoctonia solani]|nr:hypothetical protein OPQ81_008388 [Rhizoctonia solani]
MRVFTIISALAAVAVSSAVAAPRGASAALFPRQSSEIPVECQEQCVTAQKINTCGEDLSCLCTKEVGQGIIDCGNCGFNHQNSPSTTDRNQFEAGVQEYANSCEQAGYPVGPLSITPSSSR